MFGNEVGVSPESVACAFDSNDGGVVEEPVEEGRTATEIWPDAPAKASRKDTDASWTVRHKKAKAKPDGRKSVDIANPV